MGPLWVFNVKRRAQWISGSHGLNSVFLLFGNESGRGAGVVYEARKRKTPHLIEVNGGHSAPWVKGSLAIWCIADFCKYSVSAGK